MTFNGLYTFVVVDRLGTPPITGDACGAGCEMVGGYAPCSLPTCPKELGGGRWVELVVCGGFNATLEGLLNSAVCLDWSDGD